jgi:hypothetical protein
MTDPRYIELESLLSEQAQRRLKNSPYLIWLAQRCASLATGSSYPILFTVPAGRILITNRQPTCQHPTLAGWTAFRTISVRR